MTFGIAEANEVHALRYIYKKLHILKIVTYSKSQNYIHLIISEKLLLPFQDIELLIFLLYYENHYENIVRNP